MTAEAVRDATSPELSITPLEALREIDYGPDENKPEVDVIARIGEAALDAWEKRRHSPARLARRCKGSESVLASVFRSTRPQARARACGDKQRRRPLRP